MTQIRLTTPLTDEMVEKLRIGQQVLLNGTIYTGRDAAHKRLVELIKQGKELPLTLRGKSFIMLAPLRQNQVKLLVPVDQQPADLGWIPTRRNYTRRD